MKRAILRETKRGIDGETLARAGECLSRAFGDSYTAHYSQGKTDFRDTLIDMLDWSQSESEDVVDTLERFGWLQFWPSDSTLLMKGVWTLGVDLAA